MSVGRRGTSEEEKTAILAEVDRRAQGKIATKTTIINDVANQSDVCPSTLWRWDAKRKDLSDGRMRNGRQSMLDRHPALNDALFGIILHFPHVKAPEARELLMKAFPGRTFNRHTVRKWLSIVRQANFHQIALETDPDGYGSKYGAAFGKADENITRRNELWEIDTSPTDVDLIDGRHVKVAVIDVLTRCAMVLVARTSKASAIAALIRLAILSWGVAERVRTDQGSDYCSKQIRQLFADLGIKHEICPAGMPQTKPFIERFLGTFARQFEAHLPGFHGHTIEQQQKIRSRQAADRRRSKGARPAVAIQLTSAEYQERASAWCANVYAHQVHSELGVSPFQKDSSHTGTIRHLTPEGKRALDILLFEPPSGGPERVMGKKGVSVDGGLYLPKDWIAPGTPVLVSLDPADRGHVLVRSEDGLVTWAVCPERLGESRHDYALRMKAEEKAFKAGLLRNSKRLRSEIDPASLRDQLDAEAKAEADKVVAFPHSAEPHETLALADAAKADASRPAPAPPRPPKEDRAVNAAWDRLIARRAERESCNG